MTYWTQYRSVDGKWYDNQAADTLDEAKRLYTYSVERRGHGGVVNYRVIERTDKVVWPVDTTIDPASQGGA